MYVGLDPFKRVLFIHSVYMISLRYWQPKGEKEKEKMIAMHIKIQINDEISKDNQK